ncbi:allatostatin-A receptor-like isoform X4 [Daphnia pulex]|uniref:allatostatin-A receptor-like isoform X4 n=1 Tax=Daphnia pulex TaxID=6669 RepID=UPI001EE10696|nr:allatostatin-A receptor-like isoform X4 [Daphnia pulex]
MLHIISIVVPVIFGIIAIVGFFGNALVVTVVVANSRMRSTTNLLIVNLALADILFIVFCVPFTASDYALLFWPFGEVWCKIVQYLVIVTANASIYTLVLMSLDRYLIVVHPLSSISIRTKTKTYWAIAVTWVVIFSACVPLLMAHGHVVYQFAGEEYTGCRFLHKACSRICGDGQRPEGVFPLGVSAVKRCVLLAWCASLFSLSPYVGSPFSCICF